MPPEPHGAHGEREIKKFMVTKRELLNNLSDIYNSSMKERIIRFNWGTKRENLYFSLDRERKMAEDRGICAAHICIPQYREYPPRAGYYPQRPVYRGCLLLVDLLTQICCMVI